MNTATRSTLALTLALTWAAALAALVTGRGVALPLTVVPLAGFAAGFGLGWDWARQGRARRIVVAVIATVVAGMAAGLWSTFDPDDYRAFWVFIAMMATVCPLVTGLCAGAWVGANGRA